MARQDLDSTSLGAAIATGDAAVVAAMFDGATDADRSRVRDVVQVDSFVPRPVARDPARVVAWAATAKATDLAMMSGWLMAGLDQPDHEIVVNVVSARSDRFRASLAKQLLRRDFVSWRFLRALVVAGAIDPSVDDDAYIRNLGGNGDPYRTFVDDPALLEREVWRLFEVPDSIGAPYFAERWHDGFVALVAEGRLDRERVLDRTLVALATDFRPYQLSWYAGLLGRLELATDEVARRATAVVGLLGASEPAVVRIALELVPRVGPFDLDALRAPLALPRKNLAFAALTLLDRFDGDAATLAIASGLGHVRADVVERALKLIEKRTSDRASVAVASELLGWVDVVPPTLRDRVAALAGVAVERSAPTSELRLGPPVQPGPRAGLEADRVLAPVGDLDELVVLLATLLEDQGTGDDIERAFAGLARLGAERPSGFTDLVSPVLKRARAIVHDQWSQYHGVRGGFARSIAAWGGEAGPPPNRTDQSTVSGLLGARFAELERLLRDGGARAPRAEPSHEGGRLDPGVLEGRGPGLGVADDHQAALRVADDRRRPGLVAVVEGIDGKQRYRRKADGSYEMTGQEIGRLRFEVGPHAGEDELVEAGFIAVRAVRDRFAHQGPGFWDVWDGGSSRAAVGALSAFPDLLAAVGAIALAEKAVQAIVSSTDPEPMVGALVDPAVPLDGPAAYLLALALTGDVGVRAAATDAAIAGVDDGRFDPVAVADAVAALHAGGLLVLTRLNGPLGDIAASGPAHAVRAGELLLGVVERVDPAAHGLHGPLELLAQLSAGGIELPPTARTRLEVLAKKSSKAGKAAASVLRSAPL